MTDLHERKDLRLLYCPFTLTDKSRAVDKENVEAIYAMLRDGGRSFWPTHLVVVVRSWQEVPDALESDVIERAIFVCKFFGLPVIWGRNLWVSWPSDKLEAPMPGVQEHMEGAYYAAAIATVKAEARHIEAVGTMLDAEPYGQSVQKEILKGSLSLIERTLICGAIEEATPVTGPVDIVCPYGSMAPKSYTWSMARLGRIRWCHKAYYAHSADAKINANPPEGMKYEPGLFTSFVTAKSREVRHPSQMTLTPADVRAIDMDKVRARFPSICGQGVYIPHGEFAWVVKGWNG